MTRLDTVTIYLMKVMRIRDQLAAVGEKIADAELVNMALNGFPTSWEPFVKGICARENLPKFERLWDDCIQEETWMESKADKKGGDDNLALIGQTKKGRGKGPSKGVSFYSSGGTPHVCLVCGSNLIFALLDT
jgi:hypothetical protein